MVDLDKLDKSILNNLQKDGRMANADLAKKVGVSNTACWNRTKRLIDEEYVRDFKAILNPDKLGLSTLVTIGVVLDRSTPESFIEFEKAVQKIPVVQECLLLAGEFDYWLKVRVRDVQSFNRLHAKILLTLPGVRQLRTFFVLNEIKSTQEIVL